VPRLPARRQVPDELGATTRCRPDHKGVSIGRRPANRGAGAFERMGSDWAVAVEDVIPIVFPLLRTLGFPRRFGRFGKKTGVPVREILVARCGNLR
jgi:hypothetical protein